MGIPALDTGRTFLYRLFEKIKNKQKKIEAGDDSLKNMGHMSLRNHFRYIKPFIQRHPTYRITTKLKPYPSARSVSLTVVEFLLTDIFCVEWLNR